MKPSMGWRASFFEGAHLYTPARTFDKNPEEFLRYASVNENHDGH
jgi:hypothetical protein